MNKDNTDNLSSIINQQPLHKIIISKPQESCILTTSINNSTEEKKTTLSYTTDNDIKVYLHFPTAPQPQASHIESEIKSILKNDYLAEIEKTYFNNSTNEKED